jgi:hypothetical protein
MFEDDINRAISLTKGRKKLEARKILEHVVLSDPGNGRAWLWLANTYNDNPHRIAILEECLKNNPENKDAQKWLAAFKEEGADPSNSVPVELPDFYNHQFVNYQEGDDIPDLLRLSDKRPGMIRRIKENGPFRLPVIAGGFLILAALVLLSIWIIQRQGNHLSQMVAVSPATGTPDPASLPLPSTNTPKPASPPSPSPTATPFRTSSPTFTGTPLLLTAGINIDIAYLYTGPSTQHELVQCGSGNCIYYRDTIVILVAKHQVYGLAWYLVSMPDGKSGWLDQAWLLVTGDPNAVPTASAYPTYIPTPTP